MSTAQAHRYTATFTRLKDGSWGLRVQGKMKLDLVPGYALDVHKKDGTCSSECIGRVLWQDATKFVYLCSIAPKVSAPASRPRRGTYECMECGEPVYGNGPCRECGGC
jgi:hypothetical protein